MMVTVLTVDLLQHVARIEQLVGGAELQALRAFGIGFQAEQEVDDHVARHQLHRVAGGLQCHVHRVVLGGTHLLLTGLDELLLRAIAELLPVRAEPGRIVVPRDEPVEHADVGFGDGDEVDVAVGRVRGDAGDRQSRPHRLRVGRHQRELHRLGDRLHALRRAGGVVLAAEVLVDERGAGHEREHHRRGSHGEAEQRQRYRPPPVRVVGRPDRRIRLRYHLDLNERH